MLLPPLCAIVDEDVAASLGCDPVELSTAFLRGGVRWLQLRCKNADSATFFAWSDAIATRARGVGAQFVVNDRADIASAVGAGVHVGQDDLSPQAARAVVGEKSLVGLSTHTVQQIDCGIRDPISYLAVGPVFTTTTKQTGYDAVGLDFVRTAVTRVGGRVPIVAIGGITLAFAPQLLAAGASAVAVIGDLVVGDPEARARVWVETLEKRG